MVFEAELVKDGVKCAPSRGGLTNIRKKEMKKEKKKRGRKEDCDGRGCGV